MRKILISLLMLVVLSATVLAWGATRSINPAGTVLITVDPSNAESDLFTIQETLSDVSIDGNLPTGCGTSGKILTCDFENSAKGTITYAVTGTGTISGVIVGGYPSTQKEITGDSVVGTACNNACDTQGARRCVGNILQQCFANGPNCNSWNAGTDCGANVCTQSGNTASCVEPTACTPKVATACEAGVNCSTGVAVGILALGCPPGKVCNDQKVCANPVTPPSTNEAGLMAAIQNSLNILHQENDSPSFLQRLTAIAQGIKDHFKAHPNEQN